MADVIINPGETFEQFVVRYLDTHKKGLFEHQNFPKEANKHLSFYQFRDHTKIYGDHVTAVKVAVLDDCKETVYDLTPGRFDSIRKKVGKFVDGLLDISNHIEKATATPFNVHESPTDREMDMFIPKLNELINKL